jgi:hypothetical protein
LTADYYKRQAAYYSQRSGIHWDMELAISFEARLGKLFEDMTDDDWSSAVNQLPPEQRQRIDKSIEEETR